MKSSQGIIVGVVIVAVLAIGAFAYSAKQKSDQDAATKMHEAAMMKAATPTPDAMMHTSPTPDAMMHDATPTPTPDAMMKAGN